jgi:hypothetical protein
MNTKFTLVFAILFLPLIFFGQNDKIWNRADLNNVSEDDIIAYKSEIINPIYFSLDKQQVKAFLSSAPDRLNTTNSSIILKIPNPSGDFDNFEMFSTQTMASGLAQNQPKIKSYVGRNILNKSHRLRITITPFGFYAMTTGSEYGQTYINPFDKNSSVCIVFSKSQASHNPDETFICETLNSENNLNNSISPVVESNFIDQGILRRYRLAVATTVEYSDYHLQQAGFSAGDTSAAGRTAVQSAIVVSIDRVNEIYERDFGVTLQLITNNDQLINLGDATTDPYTNNDLGALINENQTEIDATIGSSNYDVGHVLCTEGGGLAQTPAVCLSGKARGATGLNTPIGEYFNISILSHEFGHQFGANHTQSSDVNENFATAVEPGSGSTIMSYAGVAPPNIQNQSDAMFHYISISEVSNRFVTTTGSCAEEINIANAVPVVQAVPDYTIPLNTPFRLEAVATDANGDAMTYSWDQLDNDVVPNVPMPPESTSTSGPSFRTFLPVTSPARYFPRLPTLLNNQYSNTWEVLPTVGRTLSFGVIVRDNNLLGGQVAHESTTLTVDDTAGPFRITSQPGSNIIWGTGNTETITWDIANTNDVSGVNSQIVDIVISTDGGLNFNTILINSTQNDGSENIVVPNSITSNARIMVRAADNVFFDINEATIEIVDNPPTCIPPQDITVDNILSNAVEISWLASQSNPFNGYDYVLNTDGSIPDNTTTPSGNIPAGLTSTNLPGLLTNTTYYFYIRANCGSGDFSVWSPQISFRTNCSAISAPLIENFDSSNWVTGGNGSIDNCWRRTPEDATSSFAWRVNSGGTPSDSGPTDDVTGGGKYLYTEATGYDFLDVAVLESPPIDVSALTFPRMKFSYHMYGFSMGTLEVEVKDINSTTYTTLFSISGQQQNASSDSFIEQSIDLSSYTGQTLNIRFVAERGSNFGSDIAIDQFIIEETTDCNAPDNFIASNITLDSVNLSWDAVGTAGNGYEWVVMPDGAAADPSTAVESGIVVDQSITSVQVNGLSIDTNYDAYVRSNCGVLGTSNWSLVAEFSTTGYCDSGPILSVDSEIESVLLTGESTTIDNNTTDICTGAPGGEISDFTNQSADLIIGNSYTLNVEFGDCDGSPFYSSTGGVWIDWNRDGDFEDLNEQIGVVSVNLSSGNQFTDFIINVPFGAQIADTRMRIVQAEQVTTSSISPCGIFNYGSVEDYTVNINDAVTCTGPVYSGNGNTGFGGAVGNSTLNLSDDGTTITGTFTKGAGDFNDAMVMYISTGATGRNVIDINVNDQLDDLRRAVSSAGTDGSVITFPAGFEATHAIGAQVGSSGLWSIPATGAIGNNDLNFITAVGSPANTTDASFQFSFDWADLGLSNAGEFSFVITYLNSSNGFSSDEAYGNGITAGNPGTNDFTFSDTRSYPQYFYTFDGTTWTPSDPDGVTEQCRRAELL